MFTFLLPKDKKLFKYIFFLAVPVILSNISRVLMGLADTVMVGHLGSKAIAGVGLTISLNLFFNLLQSLVNDFEVYAK